MPSTNNKASLDEVAQQTFDYIIIGGGTSGCLLASRLASASNVRNKVLLVEAGGEAEDDPENLIPGLVVPKFGNEAGNWLYQTAAQRQLNDRTIVYPRGRGMGGSSANNFSSWCRGPKCDFDAWAEASGDDWWKWENVVEYMKDMEDYHDECPQEMKKYLKAVDGMHHQGGPIGVGAGKVWQPLVEYCIKGAMEAGHALNTDHNDGDPVGIAVAQMNVDEGVRRSSAAAFLPTSARPKLDNLTVITRTICKRIIFEENRVVGVELLPTNPNAPNANTPTTIKANEEMILSAGTFETPHILLLSGVGPSSELSKYNIPVIQDHPNVGRNIRDHSAFSIELVIDPSISGHNQLLRNPEAFEAARREYDDTHSGPLAVFGASAAVLFARIPDLYTSDEFHSLSEEAQTYLSHKDRPSTELWLHGGPLFYSGDVGPNDSILAIEGLCQNLQSKGNLVLKSSDPRQLPLIDPAYCSEPYDWRIAVETMKLQLRLARTPTLSGIIRKPLHGPGNKQADGSVELCEEDDESAIREFLTETLTQGFHSMGSCVMGSEENKERVVDANFKVLGVEGLRLADMSVCPILTNNHTQINAYLIAERCAEVILQDR